MGHPKHQKKKYERPFRPYDKERLDRERTIAKEYGLKRKKEIWRAASILRNFRIRARELQASRDEKKEKILLEKLNDLGLRCLTLDDVLGTSLDGILSRRLQTLVYKKGFASTSTQARQLIVHGHVYVSSRKVRWPGYLIPVGLEDKIELEPELRGKIMASLPKETAPKKEEAAGENNDARNAQVA